MKMGNHKLSDLVIMPTQDVDNPILIDG